MGIINRINIMNYHIGKFIIEKGTNIIYLITGIDYINNLFILDNSPLRLDVNSIGMHYSVLKINSKRPREFY